MGHIGNIVIVFKSLAGDASILQRTAQYGYFYYFIYNRINDNNTKKARKTNKINGLAIGNLVFQDCLSLPNDCQTIANA